MLRKRWILPITLILVLLLSSCVNDNLPKDNNNAPNNEQLGNGQQNNNQQGIEDTEFQTGKGTKEEAFDAFTEKYPGVKVQKVELDKNAGDYFCKVKGYDGTKEYKLNMDLKDGNITTEEENDDKIVDGEITKANLEKVQEFLDKALDDAGNNYRVYEWDLESKRGQIIIDIELIDGSGHDLEYEYDVGTGELIEKDDK